MLLVLKARAAFRVLMDDFTRAVEEVKPAFGVSTEELDQCIPNGIITYGGRSDALPIPSVCF